MGRRTGPDQLEAEVDRTAGEDAWLWCLHCNRCFQVRHLQPGDVGDRDRCPFCEAAGVGLDIFPVRSRRHGTGARQTDLWPGIRLP